MQRRRHRPAILVGALVSASILTGFSVVSPTAAEAASGTELCAPQVAEALSLQQQIATHNANRYVGPPGPAANAYDAEAASLNAQKTGVLARLRICADAFSRMQAKHPGSRIRTPSATIEKKITAAAKQVTDSERKAVERANPGTYDFFNYGRDKRGMIKRTDRKPGRVPDSVWQVYKTLDDDRPPFPVTEKLQGKLPPALGTADPAYAGKTIRAYPKNPNGVVMDHIIPLRRIVGFPGFLQLSPRNMFIVANSPANAQWLSVSSNGSKGSGSTYLISGADQAWRVEQQKLRQQASEEIQSLITLLLKSQS